MQALREFSIGVHLWPCDQELRTEDLLWAATLAAERNGCISGRLNTIQQSEVTQRMHSADSYDSGDSPERSSETCGRYLDGCGEGSISGSNSLGAPTESGPGSGSGPSVESTEGAHKRTRRERVLLRARTTHPDTLPHPAHPAHAFSAGTTGTCHVFANSNAACAAPPATSQTSGAQASEAVGTLGTVGTLGAVGTMGTVGGGGFGGSSGNPVRRVKQISLNALADRASLDDNFVLMR